MKQNIINLAVFAIIAYILPLATRLDLLFSIQFAFVFTFCGSMMLMQPPLHLSQAEKNRQSDGYSVMLIIVAGLCSQIATIVEWAFFTPLSIESDFFTFFGLVLMTLGLILRTWSIRLLGAFFTATVQTQTDQKVITSGAYRFVRHPSYLGAFMILLGSAVFLHAYFAAFATLILQFSAYFYRISVEEKTLVEQLGDAYKAYQAKTNRLIPLVW